MFMELCCYSLLLTRYSRTCRVVFGTSRFMSTVEPSVLAREWAKHIIAVEEKRAQPFDGVVQATRRSIPLLGDASSVPFVCRYRTDLIEPLTNRQVHMLCKMVAKHASLASLRAKLLDVIIASREDDPDLVRRIETSTSKSELEYLYAPFKPPTKGSILERIQIDHPKLVEQVDELWAAGTSAPLPSLNILQPRDALLHLLATKIAAEPAIVDMVTEEMRKHCRVKTSSSDPKFSNYDNFFSLLIHLRDHQVLAIRRGVSQKVLKMGYDIDGTEMVGIIKWKVMRMFSLAGSSSSEWKRVMDESVQDAWSRLLRRRGTSRLWVEKCNEAEERAMQVFEDNLHHALSAPPLSPSAPVLALDPGYQSGIKCAVLDTNGKVLQLETVQFLGNKRENGLKVLGQLLSSVKGMMEEEMDDKLIVALGNGHGSQESRVLIEEVSTTQKIDIDIHLVNEAGASVWSVTEAASKEFFDESAASIASISIGRRLQNPLHELVKVPPRSLGLGMYQHDLSEKELDEKLHLTSVDAVATVGVAVNGCSLEILQKVPGLKNLARIIVEARPLRQRRDLLRISGLGPKAFENCAAFCRVEDGPEPLDATLVHPESYELARWLLKAFDWKLSEAPAEDLPPRSEWKSSWETVVKAASEEFTISSERVLSVIENLVDSMSQIDPRLSRTGRIPDTTTIVGSLHGCMLLPGNLTVVESLQAACPVRKIIGTIRNIADFGAFVDFGGHNDGLLHTSNIGRQVQLRSLLIGQQVGVDILSVTMGKVSLALTGLGATTKERPKNGANQTNTQQLNSSSRAIGKRDRSKSVSKRKRGSSYKDAPKRRKVSRSTSQQADMLTTTI